jgi:hypothetical protein
MPINNLTSHPDPAWCGDMAYTDSRLGHRSPLLLWPFELPGDREQRIGEGDCDKPGIGLNKLGLKRITGGLER